MAWYIGRRNDQSTVYSLLLSRYFKDIYEASGFPTAAAKYGQWFTHDGTPRALIYARDQSKAVDLDSVIKLMRWVSAEGKLMRWVGVCRGSSWGGCASAEGRLMRWVCVCRGAHEVGVRLPRGSWGECASAEGLSKLMRWVCVCRG